MLKTIKPLHYHSTPILPTVFGDEISFLEGMSKTNYKLNEVIGEVNELTGAVEDLQDEVGTLSDSVDTLAEKVDEAETSVADMEERVQDAEEEVSTLATEVESYDIRIETLEDSVVELGTDLTTAQNDIADLKNAKIVTLWTNPDPSANFASQTINYTAGDANCENNDFIAVTYTQNDEPKGYKVEFYRYSNLAASPFGGSGLASYIGFAANNMPRIFYRQVNIGKTSANFTDARAVRLGEDTPTTVNGNLKPIMIQKITYNV